MVHLVDEPTALTVTNPRTGLSVTHTRQLHPTNKDLAFACPMGEDPVLIDFRAAVGAAEEEGKAPEGQLQRLPLATTLAADATAAAVETTQKSKKKGEPKEGCLTYFSEELRIL